MGAPGAGARDLLSCLRMFGFPTCLSAFRGALSLAPLVLALGASGCGTELERGRLGDLDHAGSGALGLNLVLANGAQVSEVRVTVTGSGLPTPIERTIQVPGQSSTASATFAGLRSGSYQLVLEAESADGPTACQGSAPFTIVADQTVGLIVPLTCTSPRDRGEALINVDLNYCPKLTFIFVAPLTTGVGETIFLEAEAIDLDADVIGFAWTASAGTFAAAGAASTAYTCTAPGHQTLTLTLSDGGDCAGEMDVDVTCLLDQFTSCVAGEYESSPPSPLAARVCQPCPSGTFSTAENQASCIPWSDSCVAGEFVSTPATRTSDVECGTCPAGTSSSSVNAASCAACSVGTFSATVGSTVCTDWSLCAWTEFAQNGSATADVSCQPGRSSYRQFGTSGSDTGHALASDSQGSIYVGGHTEGALGGPYGGAWDGYLRKLNRSGDVAWTRQIGTSSEDRVFSVAVRLATDDVFVVGNSAGSLNEPNLGGMDAFVHRYSSSGQLLWADQFGTSGADFASGVAVDAAGTLFVVGVTSGALAGSNLGGSDAYLRKYDVSGNVIWNRQFGTSATEQVGGVALFGNYVYVVGTTSGVLTGSNAGLDDVFLRKYDVNGNVVWTRQFGTHTAEVARGPAIDAAGNVYIVGSTSGRIGSFYAGSQDAFVRKYNAAGAILWTQQFGTSGFEIANGVTVSPGGDVFVAGITNGILEGSSAGTFDAFVRHYENSGTLLFTDQYGTASTDTAIAAALDGSGNVFASGTTLGSLVGTNFGLVDAYILQVQEP